MHSDTLILSASQGMSADVDLPEGDVALIDEPRLKEPSRYAVLLHNDDVTTMDFVVTILREIFYKTEEEAISLMLLVHNEGVAKCGSYVKEVAATKVHLVTMRAREAHFPLLCTMEEE